MTDSAGWRAELKALFDGSFEYDWQVHLRQLNARYGLERRHRLATEVVGCPPTWFNGDVAAIEPGRWVMVVSLNPSLAREGRYAAYNTRELFWELWRTHTRDHWYPRF